MLESVEHTRMRGYKNPNSAGEHGLNIQKTIRVQKGGQLWVRPTLGSELPTHQPRLRREGLRVRIVGTSLASVGQRLVCGDAQQRRHVRLIKSGV
jgi:hypothetical protein